MYSDRDETSRGRLQPKIGKKCIRRERFSKLKVNIVVVSF